MRQWIVLGLVGALTFSIVCRCLIDNVATMALTELGGIVSGAIWVEVNFGQHDTRESSSYSQMLQEALWGTWPYWTVGCLTILAGWYIANRRRSRAALDARTERS